MARAGEASPTLRAFAKPAIASNGFGRERVSEIQRKRILVAMIEVACERGAGDVSVVHVVKRAGVSRRTFYEIFGDCEDCLFAAFEETLVCANQYVLAGYDPKTGWVQRVRAALEAVLQFLGHEPVLGYFAVVESVGAGARALELRGEVTERMVTVVDEGRKEAIAGCSVTALTAEGVVGGVVSVLHGRLISGDAGRLGELVNPLMSMIVLPYLGPAAARRELDTPVSKSPTRAKAPGNPLKGLDMRLTYRTVRALAAVAANPGSSNRLIGDVSGIGDQGQISKLLARLEKLGLVQNVRTDATKGATNIWILTERGKEMASAITTQTTAS